MVNMQFKSDIILTQMQLAEISPLVLAFLGDGIHTMYVRNALIKHAKEKIGNYHEKCAEFCKAQTQAQALDKLELSEVEQEVVRRARNVKSHNIAKNASVETYKKATSFEALIGYLYLTDNSTRMEKILQSSIARN